MQQQHASYPAPPPAQGQPMMVVSQPQYPPVQYVPSTQPAPVQFVPMQTTMVPVQGQTV